MQKQYNEKPNSRMQEDLLSFGIRIIFAFQIKFYLKIY